MEVSEKFMRNDQYIWRIVGEEAILLSPTGDRLHSLNEVATLIWELSDGTRSLNNVVEKICEKFNVSWDKAIGDAVGFTERLIAINAMEKII